MPLDNFTPRQLPGDGQRLPNGTVVRQPTQPIQPGSMPVAPSLTPEPPPTDPTNREPTGGETTYGPSGPGPGTGPNVPSPVTQPQLTTPLPRPVFPKPPVAVPPTAPSAPGQPVTPPPASPPLSTYLPPGHQFSAGQVVGNSLDTLLSPNSRYIENARQRGREEAGRRGLLNSSIAAGTAERAGIEASMPILDQIMGLHRQREGEAHQSTEAARDRQFQSEFSLLNANVQDWLNSSQYNREWNGQLAMLPIASAAEMWSGLMQLAATDPTVFTPDVLAGYQDFFQTGFNEYISRYLQPATPGGT